MNKSNLKVFIVNKQINHLAISIKYYNSTISLCKPISQYAPLRKPFSIIDIRISENSVVVTDLLWRQNIIGGNMSKSNQSIAIAANCECQCRLRLLGKRMYDTFYNMRLGAILACEGGRRFCKILCFFIYLSRPQGCSNILLGLLHQLVICKSLTVFWAAKDLLRSLEIICCLRTHLVCVGNREAICRGFYFKQSILTKAAIF